MGKTKSDLKFIIDNSKGKKAEKKGSHDVLINEIQKFIKENNSNDFPETRVRYEHDKLSDTHFVEVVPNKVYHLNKRYIACESKMFDEFVDQFLYENIGFISDDALSSTPPSLLGDCGSKCESECPVVL